MRFDEYVKQNRISIKELKSDFGFTVARETSHRLVLQSAPNTVQFGDGEFYAEYAFYTDYGAIQYLKLTPTLNGLDLPNAPVSGYQMTPARYCKEVLARYDNPISSFMSDGPVGDAGNDTVAGIIIR